MSNIKNDEKWGDTTLSKDQMAWDIVKMLVNQHIYTNQEKGECNIFYANEEREFPSRNPDNFDRPTKKEGHYWFPISICYTYSSENIFADDSEESYDDDDEIKDIVEDSNSIIEFDSLYEAFLFVRKNLL